VSNEPVYYFENPVVDIMLASVQGSVLIGLRVIYSQLLFSLAISQQLFNRHIIKSRWNEVW